MSRLMIRGEAMWMLVGLIIGGCVDFGVELLKRRRAGFVPGVVDGSPAWACVKFSPYLAPECVAEVRSVLAACRPADRKGIEYVLFKCGYRLDAADVVQPAPVEPPTDPKAADPKVIG